MWIVFLIAVLAGLSDQMSKVWAEGWIGWRVGFCGMVSPSINEGGVFSLPLGNGVMLGLSVLIIIGVIVWLVRERRVGGRMAVGLGLVLGGAVGNLIDRVRVGGVWDFIKCGWWPVFNLADIWIVMGVGILVLVGVGVEKKKKLK